MDGPWSSVRQVMERPSSLRQVAGAWDGAVAWLDIDDLHVDTDWLVADLVAAVERVEPGFVSEPDDGTSIEERAAHVASALSGRRMFLVVDRCERIADRAAALSVLSTFVEYMPGDTRMLLLSRGELGGPFSRMLLQGDLGRMAGDELELDDDEATRLLDALGVTDDRAAITTAVGGWIAAMMHVVGTHANGDVASTTFSDYLLDEVLERCDPPERSLLLRTSVAETISRTAVVALCGEHAVADFDRLRARHLPAVITSEKEVWLHRLFRSFLPRPAAARAAERARRASTPLRTTAVRLWFLRRRGA